MELLCQVIKQLFNPPAPPLEKEGRKNPTLIAGLIVRLPPRPLNP